MIPHYLGAVKIGEEQLAEAFKVVSERHSRESEVAKECFKSSEWASGHVKTLEPFVKEHGMEENLSPQQLRSGLFHGSRVGALGLLHDLQDLSVMANALRTNYTSAAILLLRTPSMTAPFRLYGAELSPYSVKVRSYLRFKGVDFEWLPRTNARQEEFARYSKLPLIPLLVDADENVRRIPRRSSKRSTRNSPSRRSRRMIRL